MKGMLGMPGPDLPRSTEDCRAPMTKQEILDAIRAGYGEWLTILERFRPTA